MLTLSKLHHHRCYSTYIKFSEESAEKLSKDPFVQKFLKQVKDQNFAIAYAKQNPRALENLKVITNTSTQELIAALFNTSLKNRNEPEFPIYELTTCVANIIRKANGE